MNKSTVATLVAAGLVAAVAADYRRESRAAQARIAREGRLVHTALGDVQVATPQTGGRADRGAARADAQGGEAGDGTPVLILHGSPGGFDSGAPMAGGLGLAGRRVIAPSRPGYLDTPVDSGRSPDEQADLMAALLDALDVPQAVIVGISGGGPCALAMAQRHPRRCSRLVMVEALSDAYSEEAAYAAAPPLTRIGMRLENLALKSNLIGYVGARVGQFEESGMLTGLAQAFSRYDLRRAGYELDMEQFANLSPMPVDDVTMPALIVHGSADTDVPVSQARSLAARLPHARLEIVDGANHLSLWGSPRLGASVAEFLEPEATPPA